MNTQTKLSASRLTVMTLACLMAVCLAACGGDDDEPTVDELLSDKTTPVTFQLPQGDYYMFDYSGSRYVGSDTIHVDKDGKYEVELRQGSHHVVWIGLGNNTNSHYLQWVTDIGAIDSKPVFDVSARRILHTAGSPNLSYGHVDIEVSHYLLPAQKVELENVATCLKIEITDKTPFEPRTSGNYLFEGVTQSAGEGIMVTAFITQIGTFSGLTSVDALSVEDGQCLILNKDIAIGTDVLIASSLSGIKFLHNVYSPMVYMLCPSAGIDDILLTAEIKDGDNQVVETTTLPRFSLQRGRTTVIRGPLFSGSTADWTVTMEPTKN